MNAQPIQLWNGVAFSHVTESEAKRLVKAGTHERTAGRSGHSLHGPEHFRTPEPSAPVSAAVTAAPDAPAPTPPKAKAKAPAKPKSPRKRRAPRKSGTYQTTDMKAK